MGSCQHYSERLFDSVFFDHVTKFQFRSLRISEHPKRVLEFLVDLRVPISAYNFWHFVNMAAEWSENTEGSETRESLRVAQKLLDRGLRCDIDLGFDSVFLLASRKGLSDLVSLLLANFQDPTIRVARGEIPRLLVKDTIFRKRERKQRGRTTPLLQAAESGRLEVIKIIANHSPATLHQTDDSGSTALHHAAGGGWMEIVSWLVEQGVLEIEARNNRGQTPLERALEIHEGVRTYGDDKCKNMYVKRFYAYGGQYEEVIGYLSRAQRATQKEETDIDETL